MMLQFSVRSQTGGMAGRGRQRRYVALDTRTYVFAEQRVGVESVLVSCVVESQSGDGPEQSDADDLA